MPLCGVEIETHAIDAIMGSNDDEACSLAEQLFDESRLQLTDKRYLGQSKVSIYHDENHLPIFIRKSSENTTALSLQPIRVGALVLPSGTIVASDNSMEIPNNLTGTVHCERFEIPSYELPMTMSVSPLRLSAWAYRSRIDRQKFAVDVHSTRQGYNIQKLFMLGNVTLEDFRDAAENTLNTILQI